jgi:FKBP-type peptidyl-prolyl cis-trans isomerase FkpA
MKKTFFNKIVATSLSGAFFLVITSCNNSPYEGYETIEDGLYVKYFTHNEAGKKVSEEGDVLKLSMVCRNSKDSITFDSNEMMPGEFGFRYSKSIFGTQFLKALSQMSVGDSASFKINGDSVFSANLPAEQIPPFIEKGGMMTFNFKVDTILTKEEVKQEEAKQMAEYKAMLEKRKTGELEVLGQYVKDNNIKVKPTASGLYFIETVKGKGASPKKGQVVKVNYTGRLIDGMIFDTNNAEEAKASGLFDPRRPYEPIEFEYGVGQVIKGWDEGLGLMKVGSKAQFIIPSSIGYGEQGGGPIPPYSSLIFDVELVGLK